MAKDANQSRGGKPPSLDSRLSDVERELVWAQQAVRVLCEALLVPMEEARRAKILALLASMSDSGRGARKQAPNADHGQQSF